MNLSHKLIVIVILLVSNSIVASTNVPCDVTASGMFPGGESFSGSAQDDGIVELFDWRHSAPGLEFEVTPADLTDVTCNINGAINADFIGSYTATVNGVSGYSFLIYIEDNRGPPDSFILSASIERTPTRRSEGIATFDPPRTIMIPDEIPVTAGASSMGRVKLHLDDVICRYSGTGSSYVFENCTDPLESGYTPGTLLNVSDARLRLLSSSPDYDTTIISVDIGTGAPAPGTADVYFIEIFDPSDALFYSFSGNLEDGDIVIEPLSP
jgi:hypothetical protein